MILLYFTAIWTLVALLTRDCTSCLYNGLPAFHSFVALVSVTQLKFGSVLLTMPEPAFQCQTWRSQHMPEATGWVATYPLVYPETRNVQQERRIVTLASSAGSGRAVRGPVSACDEGLPTTTAAGPLHPSRVI